MGQSSAPLAPLGDAEIAHLQRLLERVPAPLEPPDLSAIDGYLCGVLLQPREVQPVEWLPWVTDVHGRPPPAGFAVAPAQALVMRRHDELRRAIAGRQWFDPWVFADEADVPASAAVAPWVAGFAAALTQFPRLMAIDDDRLLEPLALMYVHLGADELQAIEGLAEAIEALEPAQDLAEAVQDLVRGVMLIADVVHPRRRSPKR